MQLRFVVAARMPGCLLVAAAGLCWLWCTSQSLPAAAEQSQRCKWQQVRQQLHIDQAGQVQVVAFCNTGTCDAQQQRYNCAGIAAQLAGSLGLDVQGLLLLMWLLHRQSIDRPGDT